MKVIFYPLFLFVFLASNVTAQDKGSLRITVEGIEEKKGHIAVALYNSEKDFLENNFSNTYKEVNGDNVIVEFTGLPEGMYAISLYHDKNSNEKLDKNFVGLPKEPYGFGNNARGSFGPPSFSDSSVKVTAGKTNEISVKVK